MRRFRRILNQIASSDVTTHTRGSRKPFRLPSFMRLAALFFIASSAFAQLPNFAAVGGEYSGSTPRGSVILALGVPVSNSLGAWSYTMHQQTFAHGHVSDITTTGFLVKIREYSTKWGHININGLGTLGGATGVTSSFALSDGGFVSDTFKSGLGFWVGGVANQAGPNSSRNLMGGILVTWGGK